MPRRHLAAARVPAAVELVHSSSVVAVGMITGSGSKTAVGSVEREPGSSRRGASIGSFTISLQSLPESAVVLIFRR